MRVPRTYEDFRHDLTAADADVLRTRQRCMIMRAGRPIVGPKLGGATADEAKFSLVDRARSRRYALFSCAGFPRARACVTG